MTFTFRIRTLGCKANSSDSLSLERELLNRGGVPHEMGDPDLLIVNSCTVTDEADKQSLKATRKQHPKTSVIFTGCSAEVNPERFSQERSIHYVLGNREKANLGQFLDEVLGKSTNNGLADKPTAPKLLGQTSGYAELLSQHPMDREWPLPALLDQRSDSKTRSFIKIQEGCDWFCTYCIIPYARGPSRSLRPREIIQQVQKLSEQGCREVVITGTNIGDYGRDWNQGPALDDLIALLLSETRMERIRLSSLDPTEISPKLLEMMARESRLCPHFHVSLQSPHTRVLRGMKRKYSATEVNQTLNAIAAIKTREIFVGMDLITGFPGETDVEFEESFQALEALPWTRLHVFPYSEREGTPATRMGPIVPVKTRKERAERLMKLSLDRMNSALQKRLAQSNQLSEVLFESDWQGPDGTRNWSSGYSPDYLRVVVPKPESVQLDNQVYSVGLTHVVMDRPRGEVYYLGKAEVS